MLSPAGGRPDRPAEGFAIAIQRSGLAFLVALCVCVAGYFAASRLGWLDRLGARLFPQTRRIHLSPGDFPAGVAAPVGDIASVPLRRTRLGFIPRGSSAALLLATGGVRAEGQSPGGRGEGLLKTAYALDAEAAVFAREEDLKKALAVGGESGGVDFAALSVDRLAEWGSALRDAAPRTLLLLGRSRGQDALAAVGLGGLADLKGKRIAAYLHSPGYYFALWLLSRAGISPSEVRWVELNSSLDAGRALREGRAEASSGLWADVDLASRDRGGKVLASTADCPHLVATVLVARGDFAARYPVAIRRVLRALLDGTAAVGKEPLAAARYLGEVAPYLGDPTEAIRRDPPATLEDNLAFFGLSGEAPVTYDELFGSAGALFAKLHRGSPPPPAEDTRDLDPLQYVADLRAP